MANADDLRAQIRSKGQRAGDDAAEQMRSALVAAAPVGETGETARGIAVVPVGFGDAPVWRAGSPTPQALFTDAGTRPHLIRPRGGGRLAWIQPGRGLIVMRVDRPVHHPGTRGTLWFTNTVADWGAALQRAFARVG